MAKPAAVEVPEELPGGKKPSMKLVIIVALTMSLVGAGAGFGLGLVSFTSMPTADESNAKTEGKAKDKTAVEGEVAADAKHGDQSTGEPVAGHEAAPDNNGGEAAAGDHGAEAAATEPSHGGESEGAGPSSIPMEPVVTNISAPSDIWIRFEAVLKASGPVAQETTDLIHQDFMAFFRTMRLEDLEGASSFNDLKAELLARANARAEGKVETLYIKTFLFE
jgi:flagellar FliL protein